MEITARLTGDAKVRKVKSKEVVAFTIVINESYKTKEGSKKEFATFINCSYWRNSNIAKFLTKSTVVTVTGRIDINAYKTNDGEFHAKLVFHTNAIKILAGGRVTGSATAQAENITGEIPETKDDLPF